MSDWMETFTGRKFYPMEPIVDSVCIEDIAHALAMLCRFNGHCNQFYSVAQHSCLVAELVATIEPEFAFVALLHDAAEAYIADVIRPIKREVPAIVEAETKVMQAIAKMFGFRLPLPKIVKWADNVLLKNEHAQLMNGRNEWSSVDQVDGPVVQITPCLSTVAESMFLRKFELLKLE